MASFSLRRAAGLVAVATVVGLAAPAPLAHADDTTKAITSVSIRIPDNKIQPGEPGLVSGHLNVQGALSGAGRVVALEAKPAGATDFVPVAEVTAADRGGLKAAVSPEVTTRYRWAFAGDDETRPSHSGTAVLRVTTNTHVPRRLDTSLSVRAVKRITQDGIVDLVRGSLRAGRLPVRHRVVVLLSKTDAATDWTFEDSDLTNRFGVTKFIVDPAEDAAYRMAFLGTARLHPTTSGVVRVTTRPDATVTADPASIMVGETTTLTGVVTFNGTPVAGQDVKLWAHKAGKPKNLHVVATGVTDETGTAVFTDAPEKSTKYRIQVVAGDGTAAAMSPFALVLVTAPTPGE